MYIGGKLASHPDFITMYIACDFYVICPADLVLRTPRSLNCLIALFYGKADVAIDLCRQLLDANFEPVWVRSPDFAYWIYSFSSPTQVTVQCQETGISPAYGPGRQITLNGTGVLANSSTCYIYSDTFKLMPRTMGHTTTTLNKTHIVLPNVDRILTSAERELLQAPDFDLGGLQNIDEVIRSSSRSSLSGFEVRKVTQKLYDQSIAQGNSTHQCTLGLICGFLLLAFLLGCLVYKKYPYWVTRCPRRTALAKRRRSLPRNFDEVNKDEMKLQVFVTETSNEKEKGGHADEPGESPRSFVTRGQLAAEDM